MYCRLGLSHATPESRLVDSLWINPFDRPAATHQPVSYMYACPLLHPVQGHARPPDPDIARSLNQATENRWSQLTLTTHAKQHEIDGKKQVWSQGKQLTYGKQHAIESKNSCSQQKQHGKQRPIES